MPKTSEHRAELRRLGDSELLGRLGEARRELFNLRFQLVTGQLDNNSRVGQMRRQVARIETLLREREIEAARIAMTRHVRRGGKVWIRVFPDKPVTQKPAETRMGSGKGNPEFWVAVVKPGRIMFELSYPDPKVAREAMERAIQKLPIKAKFVVRPGTHGTPEVTIDA